MLSRAYWRRPGLIILSAIILALAIDLLSLSGSAEVQLLSSNQDRPLLRSQAAYQAAADKILDSSIWNRNKLTINTAQLSHQLTLQFPELASVSISWPLLGHRPIIYLQPIAPAVILAASNGAFVLDNMVKPSALRRRRL